MAPEPTTTWLPLLFFLLVLRRNLSHVEGIKLSAEIQPDNDCFEEAMSQRVKAACIPALPESTTKIARDWDWRDWRDWSDWRDRRQRDSTLNEEDVVVDEEDVAEYWNKMRRLRILGDLSTSIDPIKTHSLLSNRTLPWHKTLHEAAESHQRRNGVPRDTVESWRKYLTEEGASEAAERRSSSNHIVMRLDVLKCMGELCTLRGWVRELEPPGSTLPQDDDTFFSFSESSPGPGVASSGQQISPAPGEASPSELGEIPFAAIDWEFPGIPKFEVRGFLVRGPMRNNSSVSSKGWHIPKLQDAQVCFVSSSEGKHPNSPETRKAVRFLLSLRPDVTDPLSVASPTGAGAPSVGFGVIQGVDMPRGTLRCCNESAGCTGEDAANSRIASLVAEVDEGAGQSWVSFPQGWRGSGGDVHLLRMLPLLPEVKKWVPEEEKGWRTRGVEVLHGALGLGYPKIEFSGQQITSGYWSAQRGSLLLPGEEGRQGGPGEVTLLSSRSIVDKCVALGPGGNWFTGELPDLWLETGEVQIRNFRVHHCSEDVPKAKAGSKAVAVVVKLKESGVKSKSKEEGGHWVGFHRAGRIPNWVFSQRAPSKDWVVIAAQGVYDPSTGLMALAGCWGLVGNGAREGGERGVGSRGEEGRGSRFGFPQCGVAVSIQFPRLWPAEIQPKMGKSEVVVRIWSLNRSDAESSLGNIEEVITIRGPAPLTEEDFEENQKLRQEGSVLSVVLWSFTCFLFVHQIRYTKKHPSKGSNISSFTLAHLALGASAPSLGILLEHVAGSPEIQERYHSNTTLFSGLPASQMLLDMFWGSSSGYENFSSGQGSRFAALELVMSLVEVFLVWRLVDAVVDARRKERRRRNKGQGEGTRTELQELLLARDREEGESGEEEAGYARGHTGIVPSRGEASSAPDLKECSTPAEKPGISRTAADSTAAGDVEEMNELRDVDRKHRITIDPGSCPGAKTLKTFSLQLLFLPFFYTSWLVCTIAQLPDAPFCSKLRTLGRIYFLLPQILAWGDVPEKECLHRWFTVGMTVVCLLEQTTSNSLLLFSFPFHALVLLWFYFFLAM